MNFKAMIVLFWACLIGAAAMAGEERQTRIEIAVDDDTTGEQTFVFDSQEAGFDLHSMAVGERRTLTDRSGKVANVRRTVDGFEFEVNGKIVNVDDMPDIDTMHQAHGMHEIEMHGAETDSNVGKARKVRKVRMIRTDDADVVTVISGREIDTTTRMNIQNALEAGGYAGEVLFMDGSDLDDGDHKFADRKHEVRIIKKEVDVKN